MALSDLQRYPEKLCLIKYEAWFQCFCFSKLFIFIFGFSAKVTCAFLAYRKERVLTQKNDDIFQILIRLRFQGYRVKSGIGIFAWRVTWNYAYSPFKFSLTCLVCSSEISQDFCFLPFLFIYCFILQQYRIFSLIVKVKKLYWMIQILLFVS